MRLRLSASAKFGCHALPLPTPRYGDWISSRD
jgi:hypothetical protein